ncbi:MAG TPA: hypothetical protein VLA14_17355 [Polyangia bacterium]|nr:hypothetical protein [Polyangia bacterium]
MRLAFCSLLVICGAGPTACDDAPIGAGPINRPTVTAPSDAGADAARPSGGGSVNDSKRDATVDPATPAEPIRDVAAEAGAATEVSVVAPDANGDLLEPATDGAVADARDAGAAEHAPLLSCAALAAAGHANQLETFQWMYEVGPVGDLYGRPYDTVTLTKACQMTYVRTILPRPLPPAPQSTTRTVTVGAADCAEARGWATNARFLEVLRTGDDCPFGMGNPDDVFEVVLTDGTDDRRKTYLCPEPTLDAVRACTSALVARSFP